MDLALIQEGSALDITKSKTGILYTGDNTGFGRIIEFNTKVQSIKIKAESNQVKPSK